MKFFYLLSFGLLFGCSPAQNSTVIITEYSGAISSQESAVAAVKTAIESMNKSSPCGEQSFNATEVRKTTESSDIKKNNEAKTINTVYVDEWGIEEIVVDNSSNIKASRYWSVNGRNGDVKLVGNPGWSEAINKCSVSDENA